MAVEWSPGPISDCVHVPGAGGLHQRVLRVAPAAEEPPGARRGGFVAAGGAADARQRECREAEEAVKNHEYHRLLATRDAARKRIEEAEARRSRASSPTFSRVLDSEAFCPFGVDG